MRTILVFIFIALSAAGSIGQVQVAHIKESDIAPPPVRFVTATADLPQTLKDVISADSVLPRGPSDLLRDYEAEMEAISRRFASELGAISEAVQYGRVSRKQAEETSSERYQVAMMQFQLFSVLHAILEHDIDQSSTPQLKSPSQDETAIVALPFSLLQLNPALIDLSDSQCGTAKETGRRGTWIGGFHQYGGSESMTSTTAISTFDRVQVGIEFSRKPETSTCLRITSGLRFAPNTMPEISPVFTALEHS